MGITTNQTMNCIQSFGVNAPSKVWSNLNPRHPDISVNILYTLLCSFPLVLIRRICLTIKTSQVGNHFFFFSHDLMNDSAVLV